LPAPEHFGLARLLSLRFILGHCPVADRRGRGRKGANAMTVTSTNHNPGNDSKYARHRSIWKGRHNQLREAIASLQGTRGIQVHEYWDTPKMIDALFMRDWGVALKAVREAPKRHQIMGQWSIVPPSTKIMAAVGGELQSDLKLIWDDFMLVTAQRIGTSSGAGADNNDNYHGKSVLVFAPGPTSFDIIVSKYGFGDDLKRNHHFYQWQARSHSFQGLVNVDDYTNEEGLTFYVVGS
jgi:hypothetical protein